MNIKEYKETTEKTIIDCIVQIKDANYLLDKMNLPFEEEEFRKIYNKLIAHNNNLIKLYNDKLMLNQALQDVPSWKNCFNPSNFGWTFHNMKSSALKFGYKFFNWNGFVYHCNIEFMASFCSVEDLDK